MKRRSIVAGYAVVVLVGMGLALAVDDYGRRDQAKALENYRAAEHAATRVVADRVQAAINSIYENLRTLSLLPSTRSIARHGENLSDEARLTFQQVYNNLANNVSVSEVYILPADLDPDRLDPVTGRTEEPILMFDELIVDAREKYIERNSSADLPKLTDPSYQAEVEIYEYREMRREMGWFKDHYPTLAASNGLSLPMLSSRELITCDNTIFIHTLKDADRLGMVFTVPIYGPDEKLHAGVSAIILSSALQALLPSADYSLINVGHDYATGLSIPGQQQVAAASVKAGKPDASLLYSEVLPLKTAAVDAPFAVWAGRPDARFYDSADARSVAFAVRLGYALVLSLTLAAGVVWLVVSRGFQAAAAMSAALERRVEERTAEIGFLATHDVLTSLANRTSLTRRLGDLLATDSQVAVLALDLDNFKAVNDTMGHQAGDVVLKTVAERIRSTLGEHDLAARFGGDEFVVVQATQVSAASAEALARRFIALIDEPFDIDGQAQHVGVSIGIALGPGDGDDNGTLLRNADIALYRAKADGRGTFRFFEAGMDALLRARQILERELRVAVEREEFELYYQPLVSARDEQITGFEALVRWHHPERGVLTPAEFIPLAEDTGLIGPLGDWVLQRACADAASWPDDRLKVAVNLSPEQFRQRTLAATIVGALDRSGLMPQRLELEITESALLENSADTLAVLHQVKALGVRIAMDDFGTGFSSLSYLRSFPFDRIKIDRSFVAEIIESSDCRSIVNAVAALGQSLGMTTTAEGIETAEQLALVKAQGCTDLQGYFFARPMPQMQVAQFLEQMGSADRALRA